MTAALLLLASLTRAEPPAGALRAVSWDQRPGASVPLDLRLQDERGKAVVLRDYFGRKPVLLNFAYYDCPMLCGFVLDGLVRSLREIPYRPGPDFIALTVSFDPRDGVDAAALRRRALVKSLGLPPSAGWHFLLGGAPQIRALAAATGFRYAYDAASRQFAHPSGLVLLTPDGRVSRYLLGVEFPPAELRSAIDDAARGRTRGGSERPWLACFRYDPAAGRYGPAILAALRAACALTLAGLAALCLRLRRGERA